MDPAVFSTLITGLVGAYTAYAQYKGVVAARQTAAPPAVAQGEQAAPLVRAAVAQHGDQKAQTTLALFEDDPETYREAVERILVAQAAQNPAFAQALQAAAEQAGLTRQGAGGQIHIAGHVYGPVTHTNTGQITSNYSFGGQDEPKQ